MDIILPTQGFVPRWYQRPVWDAIISGNVKRAILCWPRRHGKDLLSMHLMAQMAIRTGPGQPGRVGAYVYIFPYQNQARKVVWNGMDNEGKRFINAFPPEYVETKNEAEMFIRFKNGSTFQIFGGDDPDKLVGTNPVGLVLSEYALTDPRCWQLLSPILNANNGWVLFNSTPRGNNHFKTMLQDAQARPDQWYWSHETAKTLRVLSPAQLRQLRDELKDEALFQQEAFCSFESPLQGAYFASQIRQLTKQERIRELPIDPLLPVDTSWDLGMDDQTAIWFIQRNRDEYRVIHYFECNSEGLGFYARYLKTWAAENGVSYNKHYAPFDIQVRDLSADGKSRREVAAQLGIKFTVVPRHAVEDGIEEVRNLLPLCYIDPIRCGRGYDGLKSYCKEWDSDHQTFRNRPLHNWASHPADAFRQYAMGRKRARGDAGEQPVSYIADYSVFG